MLWNTDASSLATVTMLSRDIRAIVEKLAADQKAPAVLLSHLYEGVSQYNLSESLRKSERNSQCFGL